MEKASTIICLSLIAGLPIILAFIFRVVWKMRQARAQGESKSNESYKNIVSSQVKEGAVGEYWRAIILIRWTATNIIVIFLRDHPEMQVSLLLSLSVLF